MHPFKAVSYQRQEKENQRQAAKRRNNSGFNQNQGRNNQKRSPRKDSSSSYYVYGKSSAIEFCCEDTRKQNLKTIGLHAASIKEEGVNGYDWEKKTYIQLSRGEMLQVTGVLLGMIESCDFHQSSSYSSKNYKVEYQGRKVFFMVMERGKPIRAVGLAPEDTYQVVALFLKQLKENSPWLSVDEIIQLIEMTVVRMGEIEPLADDVEPLDALPVDLESEDISEEELLEKEPNFNF